MKFRFWDYANKDSRAPLLEQTMFLPRLSAYRQVGGVGLRTRHEKTKPTDYDMESPARPMLTFLATPPWDSTTVPIGLRFAELPRLGSPRFNAIPWSLPAYFDLGQTDPLVNFKPAFLTPTLKNVVAGVPDSSNIAMLGPALFKGLEGGVQVVRGEDLGILERLLFEAGEEVGTKLAEDFLRWVRFLAKGSPREVTFMDKAVAALAKVASWVGFWLEVVLQD
jgi:hypothetical protein